jgi:hypothetical protein
MNNSIHELEYQSQALPGIGHAAPQINLGTESSVEDFRMYQRNILHPSAVLGVSAKDTDRDVFTEFDVICNELLTVMGELESSLEELTNWKDDFLKQSVPSHIKLQLATLFSRMLRSKSDLHEPVFELAKQIKLYSRPWNDRRRVMAELEADYTR